MFTVFAAAMFGQKSNSRVSFFSGVGYNHDYDVFGVNLGTEYTYHLSNRVYVLGTFHTNIRNMNTKVTLSHSGEASDLTRKFPVNNFRLQLGAGIDLLRKESLNRLYLQGQAGLGYLYGNKEFPEIGRVSVKGSMKTVGGSFGYARRIAKNVELGSAYTIDYNWININHGLNAKISYLF